jgi:F-type H+-transporting ATPase subunit b
MKKALISLCLVCSLVLILVGFLSDLSWAAQAAPDGVFQSWVAFFKTNLSRPMWDLIMRWLNFLILVFVIVKYARAPVAQFLREKRAETSLTIKQLEEKKQEAEQKIRDGRIQLQSSQDRLIQIKERIVAEGHKRKEKIIAEARQESRLMLAVARVKIDGQIREAAEKIKIELIDKAADRAEAKLPQMMAQQDHNRLVSQWMDAAQQ